jgi:hypothetical protein
VGSLLTGLGNASGLSSGSGSGSSTGGTTSGGAAPLTAPTGGGKQTTVKYTYVIDVSWIHGSATRHIDGMKRLSMLPSESSPLLIFLGVDNGAGNAVFLVDATAKTSGEGRCKPSTSQCALLYLGPGSEQTITDEHGRRYTLRLEQIRRVRVGASAARASRRAGAARAGRARAARATRPASVVHEFAPLLTDLVIVASKAGDRSNSHDDRR